MCTICMKERRRTMPQAKQRSQTHDKARISLFCVLSFTDNANHLGGEPTLALRSAEQSLGRSQCMENSLVVLRYWT
jgi:hypothetical protein